MQPLARLLIVDDETAQMQALCRTLESEGYSATGYSSACQALESLRAEMYDLVLTDLMMPEMDGITLLRSAFEIDPNLVGIVMTGHGTVSTAVDALQAGALDYILKPFRLSAVLPVLSRALAMRRLRAENIQLREAVGIYELSMAVTFAFDLHTVLDRVAEAAFEQSNAAAACILLPSSDGDMLRVAAARGDYGCTVHGFGIPLDGAFSRWLEESRQFLSRPEELRQLASPFPAFLPLAGGISVPMWTGGRFVGILHFKSAHPPIPLGQIKALHILASTGAASLEACSLLDRLRAAEQRYRQLAEQAADIVFRYELVPARRFVYVNPAVTAVCGYTPEEHYSDADLLLKITHPEDHSIVETILRGGYPSGTAVTLRWVPRNGGLVWIELRNVFVRDEEGRLLAIEGIARDITERRQLEEQLRHAQKMEVIGRLTAGVAHDFNNLLTVINGYADLATGDVDPGSAAARRIQEVRKAGEQAAALTRQLLAVGRKQLSQPRPVAIDAIIGANTNILRRLVGESIELVTKFDDGLGLIRADEGHVEQIVMNLAANSRDAMPVGGRLTIEARNIVLNEQEARQLTAGATGAFISLVVTDTGCGMDSDTQTRAFEPFFTTKELGRGTGLGLSIVYGVVKECGGHITIESQPGMGTSFRILFPRVSDPCTPPERSQTQAGPRPGLETILVVDDDMGVREWVGCVLEDAGYRVFRARHGLDALDIWQQSNGQIQLVLTDVIMPKMSGPALVEQLQNLGSKSRFLYMSSCANATATHDGALPRTPDLIRKPFAADSLLKKVRESLCHYE